MRPERLDEIKEILDCQSDEELGRYVGLSREMISRYRHQRSPVPYAIARLFEIQARRPDLRRDAQAVDPVAKPSELSH